MSFSKAAIAVAILSFGMFSAPVGSNAAVVLVRSPHLCRDNRTGRFIKGKYLRCPVGTHAA